MSLCTEKWGTGCVCCMYAEQGLIESQTQVTYIRTYVAALPTIGNWEDEGGEPSQPGTCASAFSWPLQRSILGTELTRMICILPTQSKVEAIKKARVPTNVTVSFQLAERAVQSFGNFTVQVDRITQQDCHLLKCKWGIVRGRCLICYTQA